LCQFFGHRVINDSLKVKKQIEELIRSLLREKTYVEFLVAAAGLLIINILPPVAGFVTWPSEIRSFPDGSVGQE